MTYYNLPPTKFANEFNDFEKSLRALPADGAIKGLDLLETITRNTAQNPKEEKFRKVRTTNEKMAPFFNLPGSIAVMKNMGWEQEAEFMVLPKSITLDFPQHVVKILEAKSHFGKVQEQEKRVAKLAQDPKKATTLKQLELDRRERTAADSMTKNSIPLSPKSAEEAELAEAIKLSLEQAPEAKAETPSPPKAGVEAPEAPAAPAPKSEKKESAFDFKRREDPEKKRQEQENSLADIRALQKQKFKEHQADPDAKKSEAYQRPPTIAPGGSEEKGWFDWMWGGSSSSSSGGGGGGGGGGGYDRKPRMKTVKDLPPPPKRG